jgi:hypothetical protein
MVDNKTEQDFAQAQIRIATQALNTLAEEYTACQEIFEETPADCSDQQAKDLIRLKARMRTIEKFFKEEIGSNIRRYAEV